MTYAANILIIDDEANLRQTMARILQRAGYDVITASDGNSGLALLERHHFDMVYLDIRMPDKSGLEVLKIVQQKLPQLPVILFTAQPDISSAVQALRNGATDYLMKPLKPAQVIERTRLTLEKLEKERRKTDLKAQIKAIEAELKTLDKPALEAQSATSGETNDGERFLRRGKLILDLHRYQVTMGTRVVDLPVTAFKYLLALARHAPNVMDYRTLVAEAQGYQADAREAQELAKWHIHHIRQAIEAGKKQPAFIINVRGVGYRLVTD
jgi:two-component system alkaline phosphatase synthesis response regulator PhoP